MPSQSNQKQSWRWAGLAVVLAGGLWALPWATSAAPKQTPPTSQHIVSHEYAQDLITRFRANAAPKAAYAQALDRSAFDALLSQPGATGIRIYYAKDADGRDTVVLYAYNEEGRNLTDMPANGARPCPPYCSISDRDGDDLGANAAGFQQFSPSQSHLVSREHAHDAIARFRASTPPGTAYVQSMDRSAIDALLAQPGAAGIRIYYGKYADGRDTVVLYAYGKEGRDLTNLVANRTFPGAGYCPSPCEDQIPEMP
ncbi:hypothetical protein [Hyalangium versicolor]|uniref:hypothetical protein n=1 Tax=Hyalangium versicolor TaxID=2861190 RepID=UPI001CCF9343|nr:hypothetical protein [Hyalangium versicolor]